MIRTYKITNLINDKCYIGCSVGIVNRWTSHSINLYRLSPLLESRTAIGMQFKTVDAMKAVYRT